MQNGFEGFREAGRPSLLTRARWFVIPPGRRNEPELRRWAYWRAHDQFERACVVVGKRASSSLGRDEYIAAVDQAMIDDQKKRDIFELVILYVFLPLCAICALWFFVPAVRVTYDDSALVFIFKLAAISFAITVAVVVFATLRGSDSKHYQNIYFVLQWLPVFICAAFIAFMAEGEPRFWRNLQLDILGLALVAAAISWWLLRRQQAPPAAPPTSMIDQHELNARGLTDEI